MKKLIIYFIFLVAMISSVSALCTVSLDKIQYTEGNSVIAEISCSAVDERNDDYLFNWTNGTSTTVLETDSGTTPSVANTVFYEVYEIPVGYVEIYGNTIEGTLIGDTLEGSDSATVIGPTETNIVISNFSVSDNNYVGRTSSITFETSTNDTRKLDNVHCLLNVRENLTGSPIASYNMKNSHDGNVAQIFSLDSDTYSEGTYYILDVSCHCGSTGMDSACWDEDGFSITNSVGSATNLIQTDTWLEVNTVVDEKVYELQQNIFVCANVTNIDYFKRVGMHIYHQIRCSAGSDSDYDLDRILVASDDGMYDKRGISTGTTQMQCKQFRIPELDYLQGHENECYASTEVAVIDEGQNEIFTYATTSSNFTIFSDEINVISDWEKTEDYTFNTIINLSDQDYISFNGSGTGNLDIRLDKRRPDSLCTYEDSFFQDMISFETFDEAISVGQVVAYDKSGSVVETAVEVPDDGYLEIELRDVDISRNGWYNVTFVLNASQKEFIKEMELQSSALEGINNKTGTFHLSVDCEEFGDIGGYVSCDLAAKVETEGVLEKETSFSCFVTDGTMNYPGIDFNQKITREWYNVTRQIPVSANLSDKEIYSVQCEATYYNLGSRTDTFSDSFIAENNLIFGAAERITKKLEDRGIISPDKVKNVILLLKIIIAIVFLLLVFISVLLIKRRKKEKKKKR